MEQDEKILKSLIQKDFDEIQVPSNLEYKILARIEAQKNVKAKPLLSPWIWPIILLFLGIVGFLNYKYKLTIGVDMSDELGLIINSEISNYIEHVIANLPIPIFTILIIAFFIGFDFSFRKLKKMRRS